MPFTTSWLTSQSRLLKLPALLASTLLGLASCETTGDLTVDLPETKPTSSTFLDIPVSTATVLLDPAQTLQTDRYLVGRLRDGVTGLTEAQGVLNLSSTSGSQFLNSRNQASLPGNKPNSRLVSVELLAPFEVVYGSATTPANLDVFVLKQKLDERVAYKADNQPVVAQPLAVGLQVPLNATRQVTQNSADGTGAVITTTVPDMVLRQVLQSGAVANPLLSRVFEKLNSSAFTPADLNDLLPGLVIAPNANHQGSIIGFGRGIVDAQIKFNFLYDSVQTAPLPLAVKEKSFSLFFGPGSQGSGAGAASDPRYYTYLVNNRTGSSLAALNGTSDAISAAALNGRSYLQEGKVLGTRITFSSLAQLETLLATPGVAINRAELQVPIQPFTTGLFPYPATFFAYEVDANSAILQQTVNQVPTERTVKRRVSDGRGGFGEFDVVAQLVNASNPNPSYTFDITDYLQRYLTPNGFGNDDKGALARPAGLVLTPTLRRTTALTLNRAVLDANNIRLRVYYSQLR